jgi:hypothetical protein
MAGSYPTVLSMMSGKGQSSTAPIPTQTFSSSNILGTAVPQVGDNKARPNYSNGVGTTSNIQTAIVAVVLIVVGYVLYHVNFEK